MIYLRDDDAKQFHTVGTAIALGKFDGIRGGHQMLIDGLMQEKQQGKTALVFSFGETHSRLSTLLFNLFPSKWSTCS